MKGRFGDRREAGRALAEALAELDPPNPLVLALPRGGVPVGYEVAARLSCPLDVLLVRKLGVPYQPELAMGAISEGGTMIRNDEVILAAGVDEGMLQRVAERELEELDRRLEAYRQIAPRIDPAGTTAIVVDDGLATGSTARAAVAVLRSNRAEQVWVAVPVAPADTANTIAALADRVVVLESPRFFGAVGAWYRDFSQISDEEVGALLSSARYGGDRGGGDRGGRDRGGDES
jgi:predicted phosphoribosyltransferase